MPIYDDISRAVCERCGLEEIVTRGSEPGRAWKSVNTLDRNNVRGKLLLCPICAHSWLLHTVAASDAWDEWFAHPELDPGRDGGEVGESPGDAEAGGA